MIELSGLQAFLFHFTFSDFNLLLNAVYFFIFFPFTQHLLDPPKIWFYDFFSSYVEKEKSHYKTWNLIYIDQFLLSMAPALEHGS